MRRTESLPDASPGGAGDEVVGRGRWSRRRLLTVGLGGLAGLAAAATAGVELVSHGVLPGKDELDQLDGACSVAAPPLRFRATGVTRSGSFASRARRRDVGYTLAWPPGHRPGDALPLVVMLHGFGGNHRNALTAMSPAQAVALEVDGVALPPMAMVTVDGGGGYWDPHPDDDPMQMVVEELVPLCRRLNLGLPPQRIGTMGISMGGYGAVLLAEKHPDVFSAVAAISPAIWTSYAQARSANRGAYASAGDFAADDALTHASALARTPVRVASGTDDPFHPGVVALAQALPPSAVVDFSQGCHTGSFFTAQEPPSLAFLGAHLSAPAAS
jgi:enterochelin esterase-like enzyme